MLKKAYTNSEYRKHKLVHYKAAKDTSNLMDDTPSVERRSTSLSNDNIKNIEEMVLEYRNDSIREIAGEFKIFDFRGYIGLANQFYAHFFNFVGLIHHELVRQL